MKDVLIRYPLFRREIGCSIRFNYRKSNEYDEILDSVENIRR
jgi:hypothetical protein